MKVLSNIHNVSLNDTSATTWDTSGINWNSLSNITTSPISNMSKTNNNTRTGYIIEIVNPKVTLVTVCVEDIKSHYSLLYKHSEFDIEPEDNSNDIEYKYNSTKLSGDDLLLMVSTESMGYGSFNVKYYFNNDPDEILKYLIKYDTTRRLLKK